MRLKNNIILAYLLRTGGEEMNDCLCFNNIFAYIWLLCIMILCMSIGAFLERYAEKIAKAIKDFADKLERR